MVVTCALMDIRTSQAMDRSRRHHICSSHSCLTDPNSFVLWKTLGSGAQFSVVFSPSGDTSWGVLVEPRRPLREMEHP